MANSSITRGGHSPGEHRQAHQETSGRCQPGQIVNAAGLLAAKPNPTDADIDRAMSGNRCRCGTYGRIRKAVHIAAAKGGKRP